MTESENYLELLVREYQNQELTIEDFRNTIKHYAKLNCEEKKIIKKNGKTNFKDLIPILNKSLIDAGLEDGQFDSIWSSVNDVYSKIKVY
tara:strand:- start:305 stop:574 length:270 start_codon:yes stop_codon:yes gene_type:complete